MAPKKKAKAAPAAAEPAAEPAAAASTSTLSERALRSLKRTHEMYLSNYGQRPDINEASHRLKLQAKLEVPHCETVRDLGKPCGGRQRYAPIAHERVRENVAVASRSSARGQDALTRLAVAEAHGTGTALGDPIEARALLAAATGAPSAAARPAPTALTSGKANHGHTEPVAGLLGLLALCRTTKQRASAVNAQVRLVNPMLAPRVRSLQGRLPTQSLGLGMSGSEEGGGMAYAGVSSFGYSGTIVHAMLRRARGARLGLYAAVRRLVCRRRLFQWRDAALSADAGRTRMYNLCWVPAGSAIPWSGACLLLAVGRLACARESLSWNLSPSQAGCVRRSERRGGQEVPGGAHASLHPPVRAATPMPRADSFLSLTNVRCRQPPPGHAQVLRCANGQRRP